MSSSQKINNQMRLIPSSGESPAHWVSLCSAKTGMTACPGSALGLAPFSGCFLALFHFQVIVPGVRTGKQSHRGARPAHTDPSRSTRGPRWHPRLPSPSFLPQARDAKPLNMDFVQAECKGKRKLSPHLHQVLLCFWLLASSHRYFGRTFVLDSCSLRARSSWVLPAMTWEHPAAGVRSVMESVSYCGNWI